jgi:hypothetical protein
MAEKKIMVSFGNHNKFFQIDKDLLLEAKKLFIYRVAKLNINGIKIYDHKYSQLSNITTGKFFAFNEIINVEIITTNTELTNILTPCSNPGIIFKNNIMNNKNIISGLLKNIPEKNRMAFIIIPISQLKSSDFVQKLIIYGKKIATQCIIIVTGSKIIDSPNSINEMCPLEIKNKIFGICGISVKQEKNEINNKIGIMTTALPDLIISCHTILSQEQIKLIKNLILMQEIKFDPN